MQDASKHVNVSITTARSFGYESLNSRKLLPQTVSFETNSLLVLEEEEEEDL